MHTLGTYMNLGRDARKSFDWVGVGIPCYFILKPFRGTDRRGGLKEEERPGRGGEKEEEERRGCGIERG